ncbi:hypothetical protein KXX44_006639 [Aspergillus fumigatus]|nr:hypothetical protein KXX44_006639 [Aspergillus fumigatus]KAH3056325.1 hypothetical protein KXW16_005894 [Aspergillus fumigatus]
MRSNSFSPSHDDGAYQYESWRWDESPQYAPTPGNFGHTPSSPSSLSLINVNATSSGEYPASQLTTSRTDKLPLLQYGDWVEGQAYDEDPPTCFRDANVQAYCDWQLSQVENGLWKDEFRKACEVALEDGLDLDQINELSDPEYFKNRGVKWGIARRFVKDIRYWADNYYCNVDG